MTKTRTSRSTSRSIACGIAALAVVVGSASAASAQPPGGTHPTSKWVHGYQFHTEPYGMNGAWCGPAATRLALTAQGKKPWQKTLAAEQHAGDSRTGPGTDNITLITRSLNKHLGSGFYQSKSAKSLSKLKSDLFYDIPHGYVIVANVKGSAKDTKGHTHNYGGGHYLDVVGYYGDGAHVTIEDIAYARSDSHRRYNMSTATFLKWIHFIPGKGGYSA
ncbi:C39 family peptidase [Streptomyces sp. L2]|uniref:C39 family peptidase n=1 Tax=Streptomyces sp. L2 TaxID=2162665 RepID=UPI00101139DD|nr:C39 family peptidase [Streptomyces sp. L2]